MYLLLVGIGWALVAGCDSADDELLAQVGDYRITAYQYRSYIESLPGRWQPDMSADEARLHHLQVLIDRCLILMEGESLGLDTLAGVQQAAARAVDDYVVARYRHAWAQNQPEISEQQIESAFHDEGFDRERQAVLVRVRTRSEIDTVLAELRAGSSLQDIARSHSLDRAVLEADGGLGFLRLDQASRLGIPPSMFASLPLKQVSPPLPLGTDWQLLQFIAERASDYDRYREQIRVQLQDRRRHEDEQRHLDSLVVAHQVRRHDPGFDMVVAAIRAGDPSPLLQSSTHLYEIGAQRIDVRSAAHALRGQPLNPELADSSWVGSLLRQHVLRPVLLQAAAREAGLYEDAQVLRAQKMGREEAVLDLLRRRTDRAITTDAAQVRRYYDEHREDFHHDGALWLEELLLSSATEGLRVRQQIAMGARFADLAGSSLRDHAVQQHGRLHLHAQDLALHPQLMPAAQAAEVGLIVGPVQVQDGYSVFRVLGRTPDRIDPFDAVQDRVTALLVQQQQQERLSAMLDRLRARHSSVIEIHAEALQAAIPDYLLGR